MQKTKDDNSYTYKGYTIKPRPSRSLDKSATAYDVYDPQVPGVPKKANFASLDAARLYVSRMVASGHWPERSAK